MKKKDKFWIHNTNKQREQVTHDREGNITIVDRIKDMIKVSLTFKAPYVVVFCLLNCSIFKVKGLQVSPTELEEVLVKVCCQYMSCPYIT